VNASIVDLRYRMKDVLRAIDRGETVTVLYRGKAKATLVPAPASADAPDGETPGTADQPFFGLWSDRDDLTDPASWVRALRQPRAIPGETGIKRPRKTRQPK
jgi:antitoxin (DNA-binding transcriptional repressor) of toxin-antitoxin stability system